MNQVVSFSLFGSAPVYCQGALRNAELYPKVLPGWKCLFFCAKDVPQSIVMKLRQLGAEVREPIKSFENRMCDRFCALDDVKIERVLVRDCDSRPTVREAVAVKTWLAGTKPFLSLRDHVHHTLPLGGGLWGIDFTKLPVHTKTNEPDPKYVLRHVEQAIVKSRLAKRPYKREDSYGLDQTFLTHFIWPFAKELGVLEFDQCNRHLFRNALPWPTRATFDELSFVGEIWDAQEQPNWTHRMQRLNFLEAK